MADSERWNRIKRRMASNQLGNIIRFIGFMASACTLVTAYAKYGVNTSTSHLIGMFSTEVVLWTGLIFFFLYGLRQKVMACLYTKKYAATTLKSELLQNKQLAKRRQLTYHYRRAVNFAVDFCDLLWSFNKRLMRTRKDETRAELETEINKHVPQALESLATDCAAMLELVIGHPVHVSVKCLIHETIVWTRARSRSPDLSVRQCAPDFFLATQNSAFELILKGEVKYYLRNNLASDPAYKNSNYSFKGRYNNTLVLPMNSRHDSKRIILFLCADSMQGEFDSKECIDIMETIGFQIRRIIELQTEMAPTYLEHVNPVL